MNRRQRKKNRVGEFTVYGFDVEVTLVDRSAHDEVIWNAFIPFVEENDLLFGGGMGPTEPKLVFGFVTGTERRSDPYELPRDAHERRIASDVVPIRTASRSCTDDDRALIERWFRSHPKVKSVAIGPLVDASR